MIEEEYNSININQRLAAKKLWMSCSKHDGADGA